MLITERAKRKINTLLDSTNDCINYPKTNKDGYGDIQEIVEGKKLHMLAHRVSYQLYTGEDISPDDIICHRCDNPACINPRHLFRGTHSDNIKDKVSKGRQAKGENNGRYIDGRASDRVVRRVNTHGRKLTDQQVLEIKELKSRGTKLKDIASIINVSYQTVRDISCGRIYK